MIQLVVDSVALPESRKGGYRAWREDLGVEVQMISGRTVKEVRGSVWRISYQYGYFPEAEKNAILAVLEKGRQQTVEAAFLPPNGTQLQTGTFFVTALNYPKFMWSRKEDGTPVPLWADLSFELREVRPSD